jgi:hypothetical protein
MKKGYPIMGSPKKTLRTSLFYAISAFLARFSLIGLAVRAK